MAKPSQPAVTVDIGEQTSNITNASESEKTCSTPSAQKNVISDEEQKTAPVALVRQDGNEAASAQPTAEHPDPWICEVERLSMDDWREEAAFANRNMGGTPQRLRPPFPPRPPPGFVAAATTPPAKPKHIIKGHYRDVPGSVAEVSSLPLTDEELMNSQLGRKASERPMRILIESDTLLHDLQDTPLLVHHSLEIKSTLSRLKDEVMTIDSKLATLSRCQTGSDDDDQDSPAEPSPLARGNAARFRKASLLGDVESRKRLAIRMSHLQCLHNFIQTDLAHLISLRKNVASGVLKTVTFEEVYYLFSPGDLILSASFGEHQISQVYSVSGGRMRLTRKAARDPVSSFPRGDQANAEENNVSTGVGTLTDVVVDAFIMADDGTNVGPIQLTFHVKHFTGWKPITQLEAYPVRFHPNSEEVCKRLESRGTAYMQCSGHNKYDGPNMVPWNALSPRDPTKPQPMNRRSDPSTQGLFQGTEDIQSDVYIDLRTFYNDQTSQGLPMGHLQISPYNNRETSESIIGQINRDVSYGDFDIDEARTGRFFLDHRNATQIRPKELGLDPAYVRLLPYQLPAYEFRGRRWVWINVEGIEEINKTEEARQSGWNDLVIPNESRRLLVSLVDNHTSGVTNKRQHVDHKSSLSIQIDLVRGKGRGLIILLHGPPGSGKTSTAETIAAYSGRPLYSMTCGDIGVTAEEVEERLQYHTRLAERWGCVLLLDEADVFLMRRSWDNMERNALVSIFLRHLEYYSGILFLTSNIVGVIDEAFKSRIHVALQYPGINLESTLQIWSNLLNRIAKENETADVKIEFERNRLLDFARNHYVKYEVDEATWNARQIRNAFQTAIGLGQHERLQRIKDEGLTLEEAMASGSKRLTVVRLTRRNFNAIAKTAHDFEDYITSIRGPDRELAFTSQHRYDDYGRDVPKIRKNYSRGGQGKAAAKKERDNPPPTSQSRKGREATKKNVYYSSDDDDDEEESTRGKGGKSSRGDGALGDDDDDDDSEY